MSFSISRPGTLGGYNNTNMGFDYMPRAPQHMHAYFSTPRNPRGVVSQEQFLQKVAQAPQPAKEPEIKINIASESKITAIGSGKPLLTIKLVCAEKFVILPGIAFTKIVLKKSLPRKFKE